MLFYAIWCYLIIFELIIINFVIPRMDEVELADVSETLEMFISLKRQNNLIWAWMELKKNVRKADSRSRQSRSHSMRAHSNFSQSKGTSGNYFQSNASNPSKPVSRERPQTQYAPITSVTHAPITHNYRPVHNSSVTNIQQEMRATFGKIVPPSVPRPNQNLNTKSADRRNVLPPPIRYR